MSPIVDRLEELGTVRRVKDENLLEDDEVVRLRAELIELADRLRGA